MDRFQEMQVFIAVCEERSFATAARRLNMSAPSVTRAVAALEKRIGTLLLSRTTRSVHLSEAGQRYLTDCRRILSEIEEAEDSAGGSNAAPVGHLTITASLLFGELFVMPLVVGYLERYSGVSINALLVDRVTHMVEEGIDVAVRIGHLLDSTQHGVKVGEVRRVVCASPAYLAAHGRPQRPDELSQHRVIVSAASALVRRWEFSDEGKPVDIELKSRLTVSANQAAITAASMGWGVTRVLSYQVASRVASGELEILLEDFEQPPLPVHVCYQADRKVSAKVRTFVDYCVERMMQDPAIKAAGRSRG
ncbi:LysR family transcriptional regulator [Pseudomonas sp. Bc-h]|jgi:DNA-binding transcriptional LysR family regulator|uniref:LysR family transcriptional regulator n=1 Tax=unclassified Pseudomonas TaxID=196821 RepID=UPI0009DA6FCA|nr:MULTISPECIES: LysR family transcriptional regulator [unclassified Pseudomonas]MDE1194670.1 LysR family transcriptional regulator [Pseudomonas sp.]OQR31538.1 LysR family transcriptional regulator [Pseudomonas sp. Bc-h]